MSLVGDLYYISVALAHFFLSTVCNKMPPKTGLQEELVKFDQSLDYWLNKATPALRFPESPTGPNWFMTIWFTVILS